jgi:hypothetical protein
MIIGMWRKEQIGLAPSTASLNRVSYTIVYGLDLGDAGGTVAAV